jgi:citrate lyase subunit beta/citryl-CoA lyase
MAVAEAKSDKALDLFAVRSVLFLPASNPRAIEKAREAGADLVVLDLEDAVKPEAKEAARAAAVEATQSEWPVPVAIRINGTGSQWQGLDVVATMHSKADLIIVPRAQTDGDLAFVRNQTGKPVAAMIETAAGVLAAAEIAKHAAALIAGTNDLRADLRLPLDAGREPISASLQLIVLAARAAGIAVFDGVWNRLDDLDEFAVEAAEGRALGFDGKSLIHPSQIEPCHRAFAPSDTEIERARSLVEAFHGGAERFEDEMIERMHVEQAERLLARAGG